MCCVVEKLIFIWQLGHIPLAELDLHGATGGYPQLRVSRHWGIGGWGGRVRQHPQLGNRFVSFVRATRGFVSYVVSNLKRVGSPPYLLSFVTRACIFYLLRFSKDKHIKRVLQKHYPREFSKRV